MYPDEDQQEHKPEFPLANGETTMSFSLDMLSTQSLLYCEYRYSSLQVMKI